MEYFYLGATWTLGNLGDLDFGKFANNLNQTCSKWINLFKLDQIVSKWLNVVQNRSDGFKTDQIKVFFGNGMAIDIFGHGRVINIFGHERAINIFGYWKAINILGHVTFSFVLSW